MVHATHAISLAGEVQQGTFELQCMQNPQGPDQPQAEQEHKCGASSWFQVKPPQRLGDPYLTSVCRSKCRRHCSGHKDYLRYLTMSSHSQHKRN